MSFIAFLIAITGSVILMIAAFAFFKAKDVFTMTQIVMVTNLYVVPIILVGIEINHFSLNSTFKMIVVIVLNITLVNLLCHTIVRRAIINKIAPDAKTK